MYCICVLRVGLTGVSQALDLLIRCTSLRKTDVISCIVPKGASINALSEEFIKKREANHVSVSSVLGRGKPGVSAERRWCGRSCRSRSDCPLGATGPQSGKPTSPPAPASSLYFVRMFRLKVRQLCLSYLSLTCLLQAPCTPTRWVTSGEWRVSVRT